MLVLLASASEVRMELRGVACLRHPFSVEHRHTHIPDSTTSYHAPEDS